MTDTVSSADMRQEFLSGLRDRHAEPIDWVKALSLESNRKLLALIGNLSPVSVAELSELAERAQSNVSRSLAALVRADLVELRSEGRVSRPVLTTFGVEKVGELGLLTPALEQPGQSMLNVDPLVAVQITSSEADDNRTDGVLRICVTFPHIGAQRLETRSLDLHDLSVRVLRDWWRIFHRRDEPYRLCDVAVRRNDEVEWSRLSIKVLGRAVAINLRNAELEAEPSRFAKGTPVAALEQAMLEDLIEPVSRSLTSRGRADQAIHSLRNRLRETLANPRDAEWSRTTGALGFCPYNLSSQAIEQVHSVFALMPEEDARLDFCSAVLAESLVESEAWIRTETSERADANRLDNLKEIAASCHVDASHAGLKPWRRGVSLARDVRRRLSLDCDTPVEGVEGMARLFGRGSRFSLGERPPAALKAFQTTAGDEPSLLLGGHHGSEAAAFVFARAVGDYVCFREAQSSVTDLRTDRQAVGRAFAAEFLAPAEAVVEKMDEEGWSRHRTAEYFGVDDTVIRNQYNNNAELYA